jgi:cobalt/nickel transport protein
MRLWQKNTLLLLLAAVIVAFPLVARLAPEFAGTDAQASGLVNEIDPDYVPWFQPLVELPGGEMESLLFSLQAAIGAGVLGFVLGRMTSRGQRPDRKRPVGPASEPAPGEGPGA